MKMILGLLAVAAGLFMASTETLASERSDAFLKSIDKEAATCELMAFTNHLNLKTYEMQISSHENGASMQGGMDLMEANSAKEMQCVRDARAAAKEIFKNYAASEGNEKLKLDAKDVYIAWDAALPYRVHEGASSGRPELVSYRKAVATMNADGLLN
ncbi:hypothetical protein [Rhodanobacter denitrificans]|uniref:hypothetical protein n=1 Tax=Rhodanobacter denitrificans TaxID=666685 RepID=UPI001F3727BB|nr:hypothetical protein [Rhodanobacter denitrificans]UJJ57100.1 hypothetical protein LRK55_10480 [Rhodanobacter denitrificans]